MNPSMRITEAEIANLVDTFYARVRKDNEIGPIFNSAVHNWDAHLSLLKDFWSTVMLGSGRYKGNPMLAHFQLPIEEKHFVRWLSLFDRTAAEVLPPSHAALITSKAQQIGANMRRVLAYKSEEVSAGA